MMAARMAINRANCIQPEAFITVPLKLLGLDHRHEQINEQQQGYDSHDDSFHKPLLKLVAGVRVNAASHEKDDDHPNKNKIAHSSITDDLRVLANQSLPGVTLFWIASGNHDRARSGLKNCFNCVPGK